MNDLTKTIEEELKRGESIVLLGKTDSGKTWFCLHELMPFLQAENFNVVYLKDCDESFGIINTADFVIVDEGETFIDRDFLEKRHPEEVLYYTKGYVKAVKEWHKKLAGIKVPSVFIITRNEDEELDYLMKNIKLTDWGARVKPVKFKR